MGMPMMGGMDGNGAMLPLTNGGMGKRQAAANLPPSAQPILRALDDLPPEAAEDPRGFLLRCALPGAIAGLLGGPDGSKFKEVEAPTGVRISLPGNGNDATRMLSIEGPLLRVCAAYMLMMKRYIECEQEARN